MNWKPACSFYDLEMWEKAHQFVLYIYEFTEKLPPSEIYGLAIQFKRAAICIAANIVEGFRKSPKAETNRYLEIAHGPFEECQ